MVVEQESAGRERKILDVLLVEDNPVSQQVTVRMLVELGASITVCGNGREAVEKVRETAGQFDLILMDCEMPEMDGYEATREIRVWETTQSDAEPLLICALTAHVLADEMARCREAGMDIHLAKPIAKDSLREILEAIAQR